VNKYTKKSLELEQVAAARRKALDSQHFSGQFAKRLLVTGPAATVQGIVLD